MTDTTNPRRYTPLDLAPLRPEPERDHYGRYVLPDLGDPSVDKRWTRATTLAKALDDTYNLQSYGKRMVVEGLAAEPQLIDSVDLSLDGKDLKRHLSEIADEAYDAAGGSTATLRGTEMHHFSEAVDTGVMTADEVHPRYRREIMAYVQAKEKFGIVTPAAGVERIVVNQHAEVAGTADRLPCIMPDGTPLVGDVKSSRDPSYAWLSNCMQLATYANADAMLKVNPDGSVEWEPMPEVSTEHGLIFHMPLDSGRCDIYVIDLVAGWAAVELAHAVKEQRKRKDLSRRLTLSMFSPKSATPPAPVDPSDPFGVAPGHELAAAETLPYEVPLSPAAETEAASLEMSEIDAARARLQAVLAERDVAKAGKRRRTKAQIAADEQADLVDDGVPSVGVYLAAIAKLEKAWAIGSLAPASTVAEPVDPTGPCPHVAVAVDRLRTCVACKEPTRTEAEAVASAEGAYPAGAVTTGVTVAPAALADPPAPESGIRTKYGHVVVRQPGETDSAYVTRVRLVECDAAVSKVPVSAAADLYTEYADVWTDEFTTRMQARVSASLAAEQAARDPGSVIRSVLDMCTTPEMMGEVYAANADAWTDDLTEYGKSVLANATTGN